MKNRLTFVGMSVIGSFAVYCCSSASGGSGHSEGGGNGFVPDANAADCCAPPAPKFRKIAEGKLEDLNTATTSIATQGATELVVYVRGRHACSDNYNSDFGSSIAVDFRPDTKTAFGYTGQSATSGGRLRVDGSDMLFRLTNSLEGDNAGFGCTGSFTYVIAAVE